MSRKVRIALYALFTVVMLIIGLVLTFPWDAVGRRLEAEIAARIPGGSVAIDEVGPAFIGVSLYGVHLQLPSKGTEPGAKVDLSRVSVKPNIIGSISGKPGARFSVDVFSGEASGSVSKTADGSAVELVLETLQLDDGTLLEQFTGLKLAGGLSGRVELDLDPKGVPRDGNVDLVIAGAKITGGKIMGTAAPTIDLGAPELKLEIAKGEGKITKFASKSPDILLDVTGTISFRQEFGQSLLKGNAKVKPSNEWLSKNPTVRGLLSLAGPMKKADDSLEIPLNGPLTRPVSLLGGMR